MDIELFCLCDGAFNYNGKLTIVGTYDQLRIASIPMTVRVSIALKLNVPLNDLSNNSRIVLSFKDAHGNQVAPDVVNEVSTIPQNAAVIHLAMAVSVELNISELGPHRILLSFNNNLIKTKDFSIVLRQ